MSRLSAALRALVALIGLAHRVVALERAISLAGPPAACLPVLPVPPVLPLPPYLPSARDIDALLAAPALAHGYWGVLVKSLKTDETLYAVNARQADDAGVEHENRDAGRRRGAPGLGLHATRRACLRPDASTRGVLQGDLIVVGSGDPSIGETAGDRPRRVGRAAEGARTCA